MNTFKTIAIATIIGLTTLSCEKCIECTTSLGAINTDNTEYCGGTIDVEEDRLDYMEDCNRQKDENPNLNIDCDCRTLR